MENNPGNGTIITDSKIIEEIKKAETFDIYSLFKEDEQPESIAEKLLDESFEDFNLHRKDNLDRFLDFTISKVRTGHSEIINLAYPSMRMEDKELELKIIELLNFHLFPDIVYKILRYFVRNVHDADSNLNLANLITSEDIIRAIYETFLLFKKDISTPDRSKRSLNVKRIQQFPPAVADEFSSPLDASCRLKYILEFIAIKQNVESIYKRADLSLTGIDT